MWVVYYCMKVNGEVRCQQEQSFDELEEAKIYVSNAKVEIGSWHEVDYEHDS